MSEAFRTKGHLESLESDVLWEHGCVGVLQDGDDVVGYFANRILLPLRGQWESINDIDYVKQYFDTLEPIFLTHLVIAPTHRDITLNENQQVIWLDPGMAFGTGHHETTHMALQALETLELKGKTLLDVGSGSGILAMAASVLGCSCVIGIDLDPQAVMVAKENAKLNKINIQLLEGTIEGQADHSADIIIANLFAELHVLLAKHYARVLKPKGTLIITGILAEKSPLVLEALSNCFSLEQTNTRGEWTLFSFKLLADGFALKG
jgi:ribosomal protein L11 methyltransferase